MYNSNFGRLYTKSQTPKAVFDKEEKNPSEKHKSSLFSQQLLVIILKKVYKRRLE